MNGIKQMEMKRAGVGRVSRWAVLALLAIGAAAENASANVLEQVPGDAAFVVKVKNLQHLSDRLADYAQQWGIAGLQPGMDNPLGAFKQETGISEGLAADGEMAVYLMEFPMDGEEPLPVGILPVEDYAAFLKNFPDARTEGDITSVTLNTGDPAFVANREGYAVIGMNREAVMPAANAGVKAGEAASTQLNEKDITFHLNIAALREELLPKIEEGRREVLQQIDEVAGPDGDEQAAAFAKFVPLAKAIVNQVLNVGEGFITNTETLTYGLTFGDAGISATYLMDFTKDGYASEVLAMAKPTAEPLVTGLPASQYIFVGGAVSNPEATKKITSDFLAPIRKELDGDDPQMQALSKWLDAAETYFASTTGQRFGMVSPGEEGGIEQIQTLNVMLGDAKAIAEAQKNLLATQDEMLNSMIMSLLGGGGEAGAAPAEGEQQPKVETTLTPNAKTVEGVAFTEFTTDAQPGSAPPKTTVEAVVQQVLANMQMQNQSGLFGVIDPQHFLLSSGGTDEMLASAVKAAKANENALAENEQFAQAGKTLPKERLGVVYVPLDVAIASAVQLANANGMQVSIEVPPDLVPFAFTATTESNSTFRVDGYLPSETLQALVAAGLQIQMQMQQNQQGGQPGEL